MPILELVSWPAKPSFGAIKACNLPEGVFSLLQGTGQEVGTPLGRSSSY